MRFFLFLVIGLVLCSSLAIAADQFKPYLHKPSIPEAPKVKLYGQYQTNLFPGAATYSYGLEVPPGTNGLQPSLSLSYNSQGMRSRPSFLGAGWSLTQNYIMRDANFTPYNTTDDEFVLLLNGQSFTLVYVPEDGFYHTETETFARVQNLSGAANTLGQYWLVTLKDGTQLRFGYNSESELMSNTGKGYALKWSLDQVEDTHSNKIFYSYREDPFIGDNGSAYLWSITYNNDQKRTITLEYEPNTRRDRRRVYEQGNLLEEARRLTDIGMFFNSSLVRRYHFDYSYLNSERSLSSITGISYFGKDNSSVLHTNSFAYNAAFSSYANSTTFNTSQTFQTSDTDEGMRLADVNQDGYIDLIQAKNGGNHKTWLNNKTYWAEVAYFVPPDDFVLSTGSDAGGRLEDVNFDGFPDFVKGYEGSRQAWLNANATTWVSSTIWAPPVNFVSSSQDTGAQFADINGDGRVDIVVAKAGSSRESYLNNDSGWSSAPSYWQLPLDLVTSSGNDNGARLADVNGDGFVDILYGNQGSRTAYLNNGSGWIQVPSWTPPEDFTTASIVDNGIRLADLNGDGLVDLLQDYANVTVNGSLTVDRDAWINNGSGWKTSNFWRSPEPFTSSGKNIGRRIGDVNGDGFGDIIVGQDSMKYTLVRNTIIPYLLKNITNELGGTTVIDYSQSTVFNNTGDDGLSDFGFNTWVVKNVVQDNGLTADNNTFGVVGNTSYTYQGGAYNHTDTEFRGFNVVNETFSTDNSTITHYFHQSKELKGKEFRTETYDKNANLFLRIENTYNVTSRANSSIYIAQLLSSSIHIFDGTSTARTTNVSYRYDNYSNLIARVQHGDTSIIGDEKYENYTYAYNTTAWTLDKPSWYLLFDQSYNKLRETKYSYDNGEYGSAPTKGDLTKVENWLNTGGGNPTTRLEYDDFGNVVEVVDSLGHVTKTEYGLTDITHTYPERIINDLGHKTDFVYDFGTGNVLSTTKNGITTYFQYDTHNRILKEIQPYDTSELPTKSYSYSFDGIAPEVEKISQKTTSNNTLDVYYIYDGNAQLVQLRSPGDGGQIVKNIFYDSLGRVKEEQNQYFDNFSTTLSTPSTTENKTRYIYDTLGRIIQVTNPDGTTKTTTFNRNEINDYDANGHRHTYWLDAYDRILAVTEYNQDFYLGDNETYNTTYSYNGADELVGIKDAKGNEFNFSYDSVGRKIQLNDPDLGTWTYTYDLLGNLVSQVGGGGNLITGDGYYREYNGFGQLQSVKEGDTSGGKIIESYSYDSNGDRIKINRFCYTSGCSNETIYTPYREWMQIRNSSGTHNFYYIYQGDSLVARENPDGTKWFYHSDHLGSTDLITDENGNVIEDEFYSPFGESLSSNEAEEFKLYSSHFKDTTDQYYFGARYYLPDDGRFISPDPTVQYIYNPQSLNRYAYVLNNPYKYTDPYGLWALQIGGGASGGLGQLAPIAGSIEIGFVIAYDEEEGLLQFGGYFTPGFGALVGSPGGSASAALTLTPSAKRVKDLDGTGLSIGAEAPIYAGIVGGAGYSYDEGAPLSAPSGVILSGGLGYKGSGYTYGTSTKTVSTPSIKISSGNKQAGNANTAQAVSSKQTSSKQSTTNTPSKSSTSSSKNSITTTIKQAANKVVSTTKNIVKSIKKMFRRK